jgi:hypothetical protein
MSQVTADVAAREAGSRSDTNAVQADPYALPTSGSVSPWLWRAPFAAATVMVGALVTIAALFPAYYAHGKSLAADTNNLWFNLPTIVGWVVAATLLAFRRTARAGAGLALGVTVVDVAYQISDVASVISGDNHAALGFVLGIAGTALCLIGSIVAARALARRGLAWRGGKTTATWAVLMCGSGAVFAVGLVLPTYSYSRHLANGTFTTIGSSTYTNTCCSPFQHRPGYVIAQTIVLLAVVVLVPIAAAAIVPHAVGTGLFAGLGLAVAADWIGSAAYLAATTATPALFGYTDAQVSQYGVTVSLHPALGYWVEAAAAVLVFIVTVARAVSGSGPAHAMPGGQEALARTTFVGGGPAARPRLRPRRRPSGRAVAWAAGVAAGIIVASGATVAVVLLAGHTSPQPVSAAVADRPSQAASSQQSTTPSTSGSPSTTADSASAAPSATATGAPTTSTPVKLPPGVTGLTPSPGGNPFVDEVWGNNSVPFAAPRSTDYADVQLMPRSLGGQASILVPAGWAFADESIPSDHGDEIFYDPVNPAARIEIMGSGCEGCIEDINDPNPVRQAKLGLPGDTVGYYLYRQGLSAGFQETNADGYAVNGVVAATGTDDDPTGYVIYRVSLPEADTALATKILNSSTGFS